MRGLEPVQGEGGFVPMEPDFPSRLKEICTRHGILFVDDEAQSGICRTGPVWAIEHYGVEPDLLVAGKSLGGGLPLASVTGPATVMDAPRRVGWAARSAATPLRAPPPARCSTWSRRPSSGLAPRRSASSSPPGSIRSQAGTTRSASTAASGRCCALEFPEQSPEHASAVAAAAYERGLLVLTCGTYGNVLRLLPPLTITDDELRQGLALLEEALGDVIAR